MKKYSLVALGTLFLCGLSITGCSRNSTPEENKLYLYNWGEYIDEDIFTQFKEETGIEIEINYFDTNEDMFAIIDAGSTAYDLVCPSEYMAKKLIENDLVAEINWDNVPNAKNLNTVYMEMCASFDPGNRYFMPYTFGTVGILYNTTMVDETVDSWNILFDEKYSQDILMQRSSRDALMVGLKLLGYSCNTVDATELREATDLLIRQKPLVQGYFIDQVRDKMIAGEAALSVVYSGEYMMCVEENSDLAYVVPKEGSNFWVDGWMIPKDAPHKENAEKFLDFLCRGEIAFKNFEATGYATPNTAALQYIDEELVNDPGIFPPDDVVRGCEVYTNSDEIELLYNNAWEEILAN